MKSVVLEAGIKAGTSNYIPQYMWDVITCPCPWYQFAGGYQRRYSLLVQAPRGLFYQQILDESALKSVAPFTNMV